jgi:DNA polymerase-3 subunit epsilon
MSENGSPDPGASAPAVPLHQVTFVVVDVETTGGCPATASLTEVAAAKYLGGERLGTFRSFVRPDERIPPFVTSLTGITDAMVADAPRAGEILPSLLEFIGSSMLVGHNLRFDLSFLDHALTSTGRPPMSNAMVDTLGMARRLLAEEVPNCQLGTLAAALGLPHRPTHRALADVLATGDLLHALLERAGTYGIVDVAELCAIPRLLAHPQARHLRTTSCLPARSGVYWLSDARGRVLYVDAAANVRTAVRSRFLVEHDRWTSRLLRSMRAVGHRRIEDPAEASAFVQRAVERWDPPFNRPTHARRRRPGAH